MAVEPQDAFARARETIRAAARQLEAVDKQLTEQMATNSGRTPEAEELSVDELFSLQNNVRFQLARAFRNQGLCYPSDSNDRVVALSRAIKQLNATLTQLQADDPFTWQVYLDLATCHRLLSDIVSGGTRPGRSFGRCSSRGNASCRERGTSSPPTSPADQAQQALDELNRAKTELKTTSPDLDFAALEAMLSLWKAAAAREDEAWSSQWQKKVAAAVANIEQTHGAYWGRRAKLGQLAVAGTGMASGNIDILVSSARELYHKKQFDQAIATYGKAAALARAAGDLSKAADVEIEAAAIEQKVLKRPDLASRRLQRLALEQTTHVDSPSRHLTAALITAQSVRTDPALLDRYQALLNEHIETWPTSDTANKARQWLGDLCQGQGNWEEAVNNYRGITPDSDSYLAAINGLATCWDRWLQQQQRDDQPIDTILSSATKFFDGIILGPEHRWPERWSDAQLAAALATARLRLKYSAQGLVDAERVLQAAMASAPTVDEAWLTKAQSLLIVALAGQAGHQQDALELLQQLGSDSADRALQLVDGLSVRAENADPAVRKQIAQVQLAALDKLKTDTAQLDQRQRVRIDQVRAEALRASGQQAAALEIFRRLAAKQTDSGDIQLKLADLLLQSEDSKDVSEAIVQWQKVARRLRPGTDAWLRARYSIALALYKRNRPAQGDQPADRTVAAQRLRYLQATSDVDKSSWKTKVDELLQRCESR